VVKYLGINAAQYFLFLQIYTNWLAVPAALGLAIHVAHLASGSNVSIATSTGASFFMFFMTIWSTLFTEHWKRRRFALNYKFGFHQDGERAYDPGAPASFRGCERGGQPSPGALELLTELEHPVAFDRQIRENK
jgi:hypothetical protein